NFPCKSVQPKTFRDAKGNVVKDFNRVLATEFFIEMPFPDSTRKVKLQLKPLRANEAPTGVPGNELTLRWGKTATIDVRMGNDTRPETVLLTSFKRCDA